MIRGLLGKHIMIGKRLFFNACKVFKTGSIVRIKMPRTKGLNKIQAPLYSTKLYVINETRFDTATYRIKSLDSSEDREMTIHHRFTKLVREPGEAEVSIKPKQSAPVKQQVVEKQPTHSMKLRSRAFTSLNQSWH